MIDAHVIARSLAIVAAIAMPVWLLADRPTPRAATAPVITLSAPQPAPLPTGPIFAPSPITGESGAAGGGSVPALIGIAGRLPDDAVALLRLGNGTTRSLRRGEFIDGWTVAAIAADRVRLTRAGRDHVEILPPTD